jgi:hypothetical protein
VTGAEPPVAPGALPVVDGLRGATIVALVPVTADLGRAAKAAWAVARSAAGAGHPVVLVDCFVSAPRLHEAGGRPNEEGIVDVFEYGASPSRIATPLDEPHLTFVAAGTYAEDPVAFMTHPEWRRIAAALSEGDRSVLLFLPPECLPTIALDLDGMVALAPGWAEPAAADVPALQSAMARGIRLLTTVTGAEPEAPPPAVEPAAPTSADATATIVAEPSVPVVFAEPGPPLAVEPPAAAATESEPAPATEPAAPPTESEPAAAEPAAPPTESEPAAAAPPATGDEAPATAIGLEPTPASSRAKAAYAAILQRREEARRRLRQYAAIVAGVVVVGAAVVLVWPRRHPSAPGAAATTPADQPPPSPTPVAHPAGLPARLQVESLPYAVELLTSTSRATALMRGDELERAGVPAIVSPQEVARVTSYRVYAGPLPNRRSADSLVRVLRQNRLDRSRRARPVSVPLSFMLAQAGDTAAARVEAARLREAGVPAFALGQADGTYRLYAGAFTSRAEARYLDNLLTAARSAGILGPRVGFRP